MLAEINFSHYKLLYDPFLPLPSNLTVLYFVLRAINISSFFLSMNHSLLQFSESSYMSFSFIKVYFLYPTCILSHLRFWFNYLLKTNRQILLWDLIEMINLLYLCIPSLQLLWGTAVKSRELGPRDSEVGNMLICSWPWFDPQYHTWSPTQNIQQCSLSTET